jgi:hypothetical protein
MASLTGKKPKDTYKDLLQVSNSNSGIDSTLRLVSDGEGTNSILKLSTTAVEVAGDITATGTVFAEGDTAAGDDAAIGYTSAEGIIITGQGSTNDVTIKNDADAAVISIPTGTTNVTIAGDLTISGDDLVMGTNTSGAALIADGTNFNPVVISGDATIATNGALTIANDAVTLAKMAGLVRGKIIYGDSSGNPAALTVGSSGEVLKSDGTDISWGSSPAAVTSYTNSTNNRVITSVNSTTINGEANLTFDGSVLAVTGNVTTTGTVEPAGDTSASDNAAIGYTSAEGIIITGQGSTNDVTIKNDADADVITIPTGTTNVTIAGDLTISGDDLIMGTNTSGAALIADGTNFNPVVISGDAAIATNGALTIADNAVTLAKMAGLARGKIIYGDSSGDPAALAVGSANYILKSDGTDIAWAAASSAAISSYTNSGDNRVITSVDSSTVNGESNLSFDGSTLAVTGNVTATGTIEPAGDTASGDNAAFGYTSVLGAIITGQGSTNDVTLVNDADATVLGIPTGTTNVEIAGGLTLGTDLAVAHGGTGASTHTANNVLIGNGTSAITSVAPSTSGNVLTSNGSAWTSASAAGGGKILQSLGAIISATSGTTGFPDDNTSPLVTEGTEIFSQAITCASTSNKVLIAFDLNTYITVGSGVLICMFAGSTCLNAAMMGTPTGANFMIQSGMCLHAPSSTSSITYSIRVGEKTDTGTWYIGQYSTAKYNGALAGNSVLIQEIDYT